MKKIRLIEGLIFFWGWILVFLAGADFPPPIGFIWLILLVGILAIIQDFYLRYLIRNINKKHIWLKNIFLFLLADIIVSSIIILTNFEYYNEISFALIWILVVSLVSTIYGIVFYIINKWIVNHILKV